MSEEVRGCEQQLNPRAKHHVKDIDELRDRTWEELDQRIIDTAVGQWRTRLHACVKAFGTHFKHRL